MTGVLTKGSYTQLWCFLLCDVHEYIFIWMWKIRDGITVVNTTFVYDTTINIML